jgi:histidinol-phosphate aminotransferase
MQRAPVLCHGAFYAVLSGLEIDAMRYERTNIAAMHGYVPGKQPSSPDVVKLNTNENPYPPCEAVMTAIHAVVPDALRRYPAPAADGFRTVAAQLHGLALENIVAVNGGDELLRMAIATFVEPGEPIGVVEPSYSLYPVLAEAHGSPIEQAQLTVDFALPDDLAVHMNRARAKLLFVVCPHAPSGQLTSVAELSALAIAFKGVVLVDEAYVDFVDPALGHDAIALVKKHDNVLLLRTLSKGYSLAGLRFGYGLGAASLIEPLLWKTRDSYNCDALSQAAATAALEHRAQAEKTWQRVRDERGRVTAALRGLGFRVPESQSNFVLAYVPQRLSARALRDALEAQYELLVRYFDLPRIDDALRITIGTPAQNDKLLGALKALSA